MKLIVAISVSTVLATLCQLGYGGRWSGDALIQMMSNKLNIQPALATSNFTSSSDVGPPQWVVKNFGEVVLTREMSECQKIRDRIMKRSKECNSTLPVYQVSEGTHNAGSEHYFDFNAVVTGGSALLIMVGVHMPANASANGGLHWAIQASSGKAIFGTVRRTLNDAVLQRTLPWDLLQRYSGNKYMFLSEDAVRTTVAKHLHNTIDASVPFALVFECTGQRTYNVTAHVSISMARLGYYEDPIPLADHNTVPVHPREDFVVITSPRNHTMAIRMLCKEKWGVDVEAIAIPTAVVLLVLLGIGSLLACRYKSYIKRKRADRANANNNVYDFVNGQLRGEDLSQMEEVDLATLSKDAGAHAAEDLLKHWIPKLTNVLLKASDITIGEEIGVGAYGRVMIGAVSTGRKNTTVAIKTLKSVDSMEDVDSFLMEALIMKGFNHPNIVSLVGVCLRLSGPPLVCLEYMASGDLRTYLLKLNKTTRDKKVANEEDVARALTTFCVEIACGMAYLEEKEFIHRDLAARNCMLNNRLEVKVGDFGLARDLHESCYYRLGTTRCLPVKWMALESLTGQVFSVKSDVWSYGVLMWEIFSLGRPPYRPILNENVQLHLENGNRLPQPENCPCHIYCLMKQCWSVAPKQRPSFDEARVFLVNHPESRLRDRHMTASKPVPILQPNGKSTSTLTPTRRASPASGRTYNTGGNEGFVKLPAESPVVAITPRARSSSFTRARASECSIDSGSTNVTAMSLVRCASQTTSISTANLSGTPQCSSSAGESIDGSAACVGDCKDPNELA